MIVPINWLKDYVNIKKSPQQIGDSFTTLGLMLDRPPENDVLDLEHRMDRSDWLSIVGCARDLAAFESLELKHPEGEIPKSAGKGGVKIEVKTPDLVRRFNTRVFRGVKVEKSPKWLVERLEAYGIASINNVVDITNFVMVELGQPMHAQDLAKFKNQKIEFRKAKNGEICQTLLGDKIELDDETLVMTDGEQITGIGAIVGSPVTAVDENTTDIILDAGNYNQANIRKTSRRLGIRNETSARTEKFLHPESTQVAIERATKLILEIAGGQYYENEDYYPKKVPLTKMQLRFERIRKVGGLEIPENRVREILTALDYKILKNGSDVLELEVPYFRTDVIVEDDIVSDILRINGYDKIPFKMMASAPPEEVTPEIYDLEEKCRDIMVSLGGHEHITSPLVTADPNDENMLKLENSLNSEQDALRTSIYTTLAPVLGVYKKNKISDAVLFEVGKIYNKDLSETRVLETVIDTSGGVAEANSKLKRILSGFFLNLGVDNVSYRRSDNSSVGLYQDSLALGELRRDSFTILTENILKAERHISRARDKILHKSERDVTVELPSGAPLGEIVEKIRTTNDKVTQVELVDKFEKGSKTAYTFRATLESEEEISDKDIFKNLP